MPLDSSLAVSRSNWTGSKEFKPLSRCITSIQRLENIDLTHGCLHPARHATLFKKSFPDHRVDISSQKAGIQRTSFTQFQPFARSRDCSGWNNARKSLLWLQTLIKLARHMGLMEKWANQMLRNLNNWISGLRKFWLTFLEKINCSGGSFC